MTPAEFRQKLAGKRLPPVVLFLGPDAWERERRRK